jgi:hypothetical protein
VSDASSAAESRVRHLLADAGVGRLTFSVVAAPPAEDDAEGAG